VTYIYIEPAREHRRAFARWCLDQTPKIQVASATGSNVPVDLYPSVPLALLEGAYVDGYRYVGDPAPAPAPASGRRELTAEKLAGTPAAPRKRRPRKKAAEATAGEAVDASAEI
jgi:hypothetical protein